MYPNACDPHDSMTRRFRRVTIMGLGLFGGGAGAARFFANLGAAVTVTDLASEEKLARSIQSLRGANIRFILGRHEELDFTDTDLVVANQAVRPDNPFLAAARAANVPIATETGLALALNPSPWIGVTGSSGKSTTASLLAEMLRRNNPGVLFGGNIGGDLLTRVEKRPADAYLLAELSSFQLTYLAEPLAAGLVRPPAVAVVTNLTPNHLDWHRDMDEYAAAKFNLARWQRPEDWVVLNADDARLASWGETAPGRVVSCGRDDPGRADACFIDGGAVVVRLGGREACRLSLERFALPGRHNRANAVQALAAAYAATGDGEAAAAGLASFPGLPHRLERVGVFGGRVFVNDSKSTTPEAAMLALEAVGEPCVLLAGGYDKHVPFAALGVAIQERAEGVVLMGEAGAAIGEAVKAAAGRRPAGKGTLAVCETGNDFRLAVREAYRLTPEGGTVLLSPACASYGMFTNYEERGDVFRTLARREYANRR